MGDIIFDKERTIAEKMGSFSPGEAIALGIALCKAAEAAADGEFRGGIWPGNITYEDDCIALGPYLEKGLKEKEVALVYDFFDVIVFDNHAYVEANKIYCIEDGEIEELIIIDEPKTNSNIYQQFLTVPYSSLFFCKPDQLQKNV